MWLLHLGLVGANQVFVTGYLHVMLRSLVKGSTQAAYCWQVNMDIHSKVGTSIFNIHQGLAWVHTS